MEEGLRKELHQLWMKCHDGEITKEERIKRTRAIVHGILAENPQRLLDLCVGHISGLSDASLLKKAKEDTEDFVYMNISSGSYHYADVEEGSPHPRRAEIEKIYGKILGLLGLADKEVRALLAQAAEYEGYDDAPAEAILEFFEDENICAGIDWKFGLEDVEYNLNLVAKRLGLAPIREYPPYEEGQPLGGEALEEIIKASVHAAVTVWDGDSACIFLTAAEKAPALKAELDKLTEFWCLDAPYIIE